LNNYYIHEVFAYQNNDSKEYQDIQTRFSNLLNDYYEIILDIKRYNNNNNNNNKNNIIINEDKEDEEKYTNN
jgi:DNA-binding ferritin-like protein (Dps family)